MRYQKWGKNGLKIYCYSQQKSRPKLVKDPNCDNEKLDACDIERIVVEQLFEHTNDIKNGLNKNTRKSPTVSAADVFKKKQDTIVSKLKRLYNLYAESGDEILLQTIEENKKELDMVETELSSLNTLSQEERNLASQIETIVDLERSWERMDIKERQKALRLCINRVVIDGYKVTIQYNF